MTYKYINQHKFSYIAMSHSMINAYACSDDIYGSLWLSIGGNIEIMLKQVS